MQAFLTHFHTVHPNWHIQEGTHAAEHAFQAYLAGGIPAVEEFMEVLAEDDEVPDLFVEMEPFSDEDEMDEESDYSIDGEWCEE